MGTKIRLTISPRKRNNLLHLTSRRHHATHSKKNLSRGEKKEVSISNGQAPSTSIFHIHMTT